MITSSGWFVPSPARILEEMEVMCPLVKRIEHVEATGSILIELKPVKGETVIAGIEVIAE